MDIKRLFAVCIWGWISDCIVDILAWLLSQAEVEGPCKRQLKACFVYLGLVLYNWRGPTFDEVYCRKSRKALNPGRQSLSMICISHCFLFSVPRKKKRKENGIAREFHTK